MTKQEEEILNEIDRIIRKSAWLYWFAKVPRHHIAYEILKYLKSKGVVK